MNTQPPRGNGQFTDYRAAHRPDTTTVIESRNDVSRAI